MPLSLKASTDDDGRRLDRILRKALPDMPLSAVHRLLRQGCVRVNEKAAAANLRIHSGDLITLPDNDFFTSNHTNTGAKLQKSADFIVPMILFEGGGLLIINKPAGIVVHGNESLTDLVISYLKPKLPPSLSFAPGPLHRLDRQSSGVLAFSASLEGARQFSAMMRQRLIKKQYLAIVEGLIEKPEIWQDELIRSGHHRKTYSKPKPGAVSKTAVTKVKPLASNSLSTLILAEIETGRTHQIRAQAAGRAHPLLGDRKYGAALIPEYSGCFYLHAWRMELPPPLSVLLEAPLPQKFRKKIFEFYKVDSLHAIV